MLLGLQRGPLHSLIVNAYPAPHITTLPAATQPRAAIDVRTSSTFLDAPSLFMPEILEGVIVGYDAQQYTAL